MLRLIPVALLLLAAPTGAATSDMITAITASPALKQGPISIGAAQWRCAGSTCTGPMSNNRLGDARGCRELAKIAGAVSAYQGRRGPLNPQDLVKCNEHALPRS